MALAGITLLGLGPGNGDLLTRQAWQVLESASEVYVRTRQHPAVHDFPSHLKVYSFDEYYQTGSDFTEVYARIVAKVLALGRQPAGVVYAVPGHPFVAEATSLEIARQARQEGIPLRVVEGISFIESTFNVLGVDPLPHTALVDALELADQHVPPFPPDAPALIAQIYSREVASDVKLCLMEVYPDQHPVKLVHAAGTDGVMVEALLLYEIDRSPHIGLLTSLYLPPYKKATSFEAFQEVIAHLRAPDGCPWDRKQTHQSLRPYLLEETYELLAALDAGDIQATQEELGDLLLQVVLHAQIANEDGEFNMAQILETVNTKIVHRHPHVFGSVKVEGVENVLENWERLKAAERQANGKVESSSLDGIANALPALVQADQYQGRAARFGFEWPDFTSTMAKVQEEALEVAEADSDEARRWEVGDLLFAFVNLARRLHVDAESALREANARFRKRFGYLELAARQQGRDLSDFTLDEMLALWQAAKNVPD